VPRDLNEVDDAEHQRAAHVDLGSGRIVASGIEAPNTLANLV
jgi:hypothetical protein